MDIEEIVLLLQNAGFRVVGVDTARTYLLIEDPNCLINSFETFFHYAWTIIVFITAILLFGWGISKIRGAKTDLVTNFRNLLIIFGVFSAVPLIINMVYGDDIHKVCKRQKIPVAEVNELLSLRQTKLSGQKDFYEMIDIDDTGAVDDGEEIDPDDLTPVSIPDDNTYTDDDSQTDVVQKKLNRGTIPRDPMVRQGTTPADSGSDGASDGDTSESGAPAPVSHTTQSTSHASGNHPTSATKSGKRDVLYTYPDGTKVKRSGGTRAWRNNNHGNLRYYQFAKEHGAIGEAGGFAVFPDEQTGLAALESLLKTDKYQNLTVRQAISQYDPSNSTQYLKNLQDKTGLNASTYLRDLSDRQMKNVVSAIRTIEGWKVGTETRV